MNLQNKIFAALIVLCFFMTNGWAQNHPIQHTVKKGETLYRLSKTYGVTVDQILQHNPGLSVSGLKDGMVVILPSTIATAEDATAEQLPLKQHKVKRKETLWSISQRYGITVDDLKKANPQIAPKYKIKRGTKLNIPVVKEVVEVAEPVKTAKVGMSRVKVGVVLPFDAKGVASERCVEFYRGFLMAADVMRNQGRDIEIYTYDEPLANASVQPQLEQIKNHQVDVLVGPLYFEHFTPFAHFATANKVFTIFPFSSKVHGIENNRYAMLLNAPDAQKTAYAVRLFRQQFTNCKVVFLLDNEGNELSFMHALRNELVQGGVEVADLAPGYTDADLQAVCSTQKGTVFVPAGSTKQTCQEVVSRIKLLRARNAQSNIALLGYPEWLEWENEKITSYADANTYVFTNAYYAAGASDVKQFRRVYKDWFKADLLDVRPCMALLGYDCAYAVLEGMFSCGKDFLTNDGAASAYSGVALQSNMRFQSIAPEGGYVNNSMMFIHYAPNGSIEKIYANE